MTRAHHAHTCTFTHSLTHSLTYHPPTHTQTHTHTHFSHVGVYAKATAGDDVFSC